MRFFKANFCRYCVKKARNVPENKFFRHIGLDFAQLKQKHCRHSSSAMFFLVTSEILNFEPLPSHRSAHFPGTRRAL